MQRPRLSEELEEIRQAVPPQDLEALLQSKRVKQADGRLWFVHVAYGEPESRPIVADLDGNVWIGKTHDAYDLVHEEYGSGLSRLLGCNSPEIDSAVIGEKRYILSRFISSSREPIGSELANLGKHAVLPRLLVGTSQKGETYRFRTDIHPGQFLIGPDGSFYQIDFSPHPEQIFSTLELKARLLNLGLPCSPSDAVIAAQLQELKNHSFDRLYRGMTRVSRVVNAHQAEAISGLFQKTYAGIERILSHLEAAQPVETNGSLTHWGVFVNGQRI